MNKVTVKNVVFVFFAMCFSAEVMAANLATSHEIVAVMPSSAGLHLHLKEKPEGCTGSWWSTQVVIKKEAANYDALVSAAHMAFVAGKKITGIHYSVEGSGDCSYGNQLNVGTFKVIK